jgi:hypothetical protein
MARFVLSVAVLVTALGGAAVGAEPQNPATPRPKSEEPQPAPEVRKPGVAGVYLCEGTNPDGSPYKGLVEISAVDSTYLVHWVMANGAEVLGVGILRSGILSVSYFGGTPAVAVYRVDGDRLHGEWTMGGTEGMLYSETLTKMPEHASPQQGPERPRRGRPARPAQGGLSI